MWGPLSSSSPVKYHGVPLITWSVEEQKRSKPSLPVKRYFADSTLLVALSILSLEMRAFTPGVGGVPWNAVPISWFITTVYVPERPLPRLPRSSSSSSSPSSPRPPLFEYAPSPSGIPDI